MSIHNLFWMGIMGWAVDNLPLSMGSVAMDKEVQAIFDGIAKPDRINAEWWLSHAKEHGLEAGVSVEYEGGVCHVCIHVEGQLQWQWNSYRGAVEPALLQEA